MSSFLLVLRKIEYLIFVTLRESLLARNHWLILLNSLFTVANNTGMLQFGKNRLVSFVKIIGSRILEAFCESLTKSRNRSSPNIEPV